MSSKTNLSRSNTVCKNKKRKPLSTLVPSAIDQNILITSHGNVINLAQKGKKRAKLEIEKSTTGCKHCRDLQMQHKAIQTENTALSPSSKIAKVSTETKSDKSNQVNVESDRAYEWMTSKDQPEDYWKVLAEQRRVALEETLEENQKLHEKLDDEAEKVEILEAENEQLRKMADEFEKIKPLITELL